MKISVETKKRIAQLVEKSDMGIGILAKRIGTSYSTLWNFLYGETRNFGKIQELADALGLTLYQLTTGGFENAPARFMPAAEPAASSAFTGGLKVAVYQSTLPDDGYALGGDAAAQVSRLIGEDANRVFAIRVKGDAMSPRYYWGETVYCGYGLMPKPGDDCLVELVTGAAYLKIYVGERNGAYVFRQLNPPQEWSRPVATVKTIHAVVGRG